MKEDLCILNPLFSNTGITSLKHLLSSSDTSESATLEHTYPTPPTFLVRGNGREEGEGCGSGIKYWLPLSLPMAHSLTV